MSTCIQPLSYNPLWRVISGNSTFPLSTKLEIVVVGSFRVQPRDNTSVLLSTTPGYSLGRSCPFFQIHGMDSSVEITPAESATDTACHSDGPASK
jgi:hypothetical protein